jgi:photosystem II stability/assembly factor-like uncharacterized protein
VLLLVLVAPPISGSAAPSCSVLDGKYNVHPGEWADGIQAPGISVVSASDQSVVFTVDGTHTLDALCVKTGGAINGYRSDTALPARGPVTVTLTPTATGSGKGIGSVSFDTSVSPVTCPDVAPPSTLHFDQPVYIDQHRDGGEPVSIVADDGSLIAGAHLGTTLIKPQTVPDPDWVQNYRNQTLVWRSTDDGATWQHIEVLPLTNMHSPTSTGFSDPDFAKDSAGNLYGTEIDLANVSVFSSHDGGKTWPDANAIADSGDRPWLAARGPNVVYLRVTGDLEKSTDGGQTWTTLTDPPNAYGKLFADPTDPNGLLIARNPAQGAGVVVSRDDGQHWTTYPVPGSKRIDNTVITGVGVDKQGWAYEGYIQGTSMLFSSWDPSNQQWASPVTIPRVGTGSRLMWAWTVAGAGGRAAVGWYELTPVAGQTNTFDIRVYVAVTENAHGTTVTCSDGSTKFVPPMFSVADAIGRPIYRGAQPCTGTGCNASGDRRLGDFFTVNYDAAGKVFVTTGDTQITGPAGQPDTQSHPLFAIADSGSPRLVGSSACSFLCP